MTKAEQEAKRAEIARARLQLAQAYVEVFGPEGGRSDRQRLVLENLQAQGYLRHTTVPEGTIDPYATHLLEGRRQLVLHIETMIQEGQHPKAP